MAVMIMRPSGQTRSTASRWSGSAFALGRSVWHDYGNAAYPELTGYLDALSDERRIFHVSGTMICICFNDPSEQIIPRIVRLTLEAAGKGQDPAEIGVAVAIAQLKIDNPHP